ncbi:nucleotidyl transferase AbiEii/AbiGii toxin family protein [Nocardia sp. NPDC024068]|uniref:nucleotidyl transferase AbiEii/AbiGii toxin family protein n=1 Tax=Nocardia sp. NPDC024068 TaxID=3157197 RepID=UPI0033F4C921
MVDRKVSAELAAVLESAARLQELVPDAVLVGGSAAALYAGHRDSFDHDHVLSDLRDRFDMVLEAIESEGEWVTNRVRPGKLILGRLGDIEAGVRQLIRTRPLEAAVVEVQSGRSLQVPTPEETLRIKAFLMVRRNQTRDYLDVAALSEQMGTVEAAAVLDQIDQYYADQRLEGVPVSTQVARQLADPRPADVSVTRQLPAYRNLDRRWHEWSRVRAQCRDVAVVIAGGRDDSALP